MDAKLDKISELSNILCEKESLGKKIVAVNHEFGLGKLMRQAHITKDMRHLIELMSIIRRYLLSPDHPFRSESLRSTYGLFLLELTAIQERTIVDIADRLHFSETASFTRFFTRMKGMNPREFRKGK